LKAGIYATSTNRVVPFWEKPTCTLENVFLYIGTLRPSTVFVPSCISKPALIIALIFLYAEVWGKPLFSIASTHNIGWVQSWSNWRKSPSIADVFYFLFYPFTIGFIFFTLKFFAFPLSKPKVTLIAIITIGAIFVYTGLSYEAFEGDILNFDFAYGMIFVSAAALTAGLSTLGIISFKYSLQGLVWLLILGSLLVDSVANIWYYHLELFEGYIALDTIDTLILVTYMLMFYGLYRHYRYSTWSIILQTISNFLLWFLFSSKIISLISLSDSFSIPKFLPL